MRILNYYYGRWARLRLLNWQPYIIVLTGDQNQSLLHAMLTSQLGQQIIDIQGDQDRSSLEALYQLLGFSAPSTQNFSFWQNPRQFWSKSIKNWHNFWLAPLQVNKKLPRQQILLISGLNKSGESQFFAQLIEPDITVWSGRNPQNSLEASHFALETQDLVMIDGDSAIIGQILGKIQTPAQIVGLTQKDHFLRKKNAKFKPIASYQPTPAVTNFHFRAGKVSLPSILPEKAWLPIAMTEKIMELLNQKFDRHFLSFNLPTGQGNCEVNQAGQIILDASGQTLVEALDNFLEAFDTWGAGKKQKWLIMSDLDMISDPERSKIVTQLSHTATLSRIILISAAAEEWLKSLRKSGVQRAVATATPAAAREYLSDNLCADESIMIAGGGHALSPLVKSLQK